MIKTSFKEAITSNLDLTIVVPTYNLGHYLPETLKSIQQQTIDFELWLIDDASTDGTAQTVADFVKGIPNFHATGFNDHRGIGAARNFGIDHATGQAVAFVDGDDLIAQTFAETLSHGFTSGVVVTAVGYDWWHRSRGGPNRFQLLSQREMFDQVSRHGSEVGGYIWNKAFSRDALTAGNIRYDEQLRIAEDYYFTADFVAHTPGKYAYNPTILYTKVNRPNSTMHNFSWADRRQEDQIFERIHRMRQLIQ